MRQIYIKNTAKRAEEEITRKNPNFNFSDFYENALLSFLEKTDNLNVEFLESRLRDEETKKEDAQKEIQRLSQLLIKAKVIEEQKQKDKNEKELADKNLLDERLRIAKGNIKEFYGIKNKETIEKLSHEFVQCYFYLKNIKNIWEFMEGKGYKQIEEDNEEISPEEEADLLLNNIKGGNKNEQ